MTTKEEVVVVREDDIDDDDEPVSPTGQYFNSSALSVSIIVVFESEIPIDDAPAMSVLQNLFLPISPRFSSIMVKDNHGVQHWKKVEVKLEDHIFIPVFPPDLSPESYEEHIQNYLSKIAMDPFLQTKPLWEMHIIKYPTISSGSAGTVVFKLHHALGDGFSLMCALFSCVHRADDPSLPLTFPSQQRRPTRNPKINICNAIPHVMSTCFNTARDFTSSLVKSSFVEDDQSPIRSAAPGVEFRPVTISTVTFPLDSIKKIKTKLRGTVNDVIAGIVFYGTQLYMQSVGKGGKVGNSTALVLLNTRSINGYKTLEEMNRPNAKSLWGNQFGFLHISIPKCKDAENASPLDFIVKTKKIIKRKRSSLAVYLTGRLLEILRRFKGSEAAAQYIHRTLRSTSMAITNLIGPLEQIHIAGHPVRSFYFMVVGGPQSLRISVVSYMGMLKVAMGTEEGFIDSKLLVSCMEKAFARILDEAVAGKRT